MGFHLLCTFAERNLPFIALLASHAQSFLQRG